MIHLLGAGNIGCLLATYLRKTPLELVLRPETYTNFIKGGSRVQLNIAQAHTINSEFNASPTTSSSQIYKLIVATKTYQLEAALKSVKHRLTPDSTVCVFHNGMGIESVINKLPTTKINFGITNSGVKRLQNFTYEYTGNGSAFINGHLLPELLNGDASVLNIKELDSTDFQYQQKLKLAVNSVINPLTALLGVANGEIPQTSLFIDLITESSTSLGLNPQTVHNLVLDVMKSTYTNKSSMLSDITTGETEVNHINGYIAQLSNSSPINKVLTQLIEMKCSK